MDKVPESAVQRLAELGVIAVGILEWRDIMDAVASLVYGPRLERVLVTWECATEQEKCRENFSLCPHKKFEINFCSQHIQRFLLLKNSNFPVNSYKLHTQFITALREFRENVRLTEE